MGQLEFVPYRRPHTATTDAMPQGLPLAPLYQIRQKKSFQLNGVPQTETTKHTHVHDKIVHRQLFI